VLCHLGFTALKAAHPGIEACATLLRNWEAKHAPPASAPVKPEHVPRQAPVPQPQPVPQKQLKVEDALGYLERVKTTFASNPKVYSDFLDIMKDFKNKSIDTPGVIRRVSQLFGHAHTELILQFNTFLPVGYKIDAADLNDPNHAAFCPIRSQQLVKQQPPPPITQQPLAQPALPPAPLSAMPQPMPTQTVSAAWLRRNEFVASSYGRAPLAEPETSAAGWPLTPPVEPIQPPLIELHMAAKNSDDNIGEAMVSKMIAQGADVNVEDVEGRTALFFASEHGRDATVGALLKVPNIDLNKTDRIGRTPLMAAAINGRANAVTALLRAGADWKLEAKGGFYEKKTARDCAERLKQEEVVKAFEQWEEATQQQLKPKVEKKEGAPEKERAPEKPKAEQAATSGPPAAAPAAAPAAETPKTSEPDTPAIKTEPKPAAENTAERSVPPAAAAATAKVASAEPSVVVKTEGQAGTAAVEDDTDEDPAAV
jgi:ankyrin repeat protein